MVQKQEVVVELKHLNFLFLYKMHHYCSVSCCILNLCKILYCPMYPQLHTLKSEDEFEAVAALPEFQMLLEHSGCRRVPSVSVR